MKHEKLDEEAYVNEDEDKMECPWLDQKVQMDWNLDASFLQEKQVATINGENPQALIPIVGYGGHEGWAMSVTLESAREIEPSDTK